MTLYQLSLTVGRSLILLKSLGTLAENCLSLEVVEQVQLVGVLLGKGEVMVCVD